MTAAFAHFAWHTEDTLPAGDALLAERSLEVLASLCEHLTRRAEEGQGVSCPDAWHVGCGIIPKGSESFRFISLLLKLSMGIIFLASSVSLILGWCGSLIFILIYVEYFLFWAFLKWWKRARDLQFEEHQWMKCEPPLGGKIPKKNRQIELRFKLGNAWHDAKWNWKLGWRPAHSLSSSAHCFTLKAGHDIHPRSSFGYPSKSSFGLF